MPVILSNPIESGLNVITGWLSGALAYVKRETIVAFLLGVLSSVIGNIIDRRVGLTERTVSRFIRKLRTPKPIISRGIVGLESTRDGWLEEDIALDMAHDVFMLKMPDTVANMLRSRDRGDEVHKPRCFVTGKTLSELGSEIGVVDLQQRIDKIGPIVADEFVDANFAVRERGGHIPFNGEKLGLKNMLYHRLGFREDSTVSLTFYRTDHFTHRVFHEVLYSLPESHPIRALECDQIQSLKGFSLWEHVLRYYPFLTSFGVNCHVILDPYEDDQNRFLVMARRSTRVEVTGPRPLWHVSMNEAFAQRDFEEARAPRLNTCVRRGLREELGIEDSEIVDAPRFFDLFFVPKHFEIGIGGTVIVRLSPNELLDRIGKDSRWELEGRPECIPYQRRSIESFIRKNEADFTPAGLFLLKSLAARM